jgi:hypothetical protein
VLSVGVGAGAAGDFIYANGRRSLAPIVLYQQMAGGLAAGVLVTEVNAGTQKFRSGDFDACDAEVMACRSKWLAAEK